MRSTLRILGALALSLALAVVPLGCDDDDDPIRPSDSPADHTVNRDGIGHAPGLEDPGVNCTDCHGVDLSGGDNGEPSCFACHGQVW